MKTVSYMKDPSVRASARHSWQRVFFEELSPIRCGDIPSGRRYSSKLMDRGGSIPVSYLKKSIFRVISFHLDKKAYVDIGEDRTGPPKPPQRYAIKLYYLPVNYPSMRLPQLRGGSNIGKNSPNAARDFMRILQCKNIHFENPK